MKKMGIQPFLENGQRLSSLGWVGEVIPSAENSQKCLCKLFCSSLGWYHKHH